MTPTGVIGIGLLAVTVLAALPALVLFAELLAAALQSERSDEASAVARADRHEPIAVLMPAHNEAEGLAPVIAAVRAQLRSQDRLLVVADNCSDETAALARAAGAEVTERFDAVRRGKGYALDHGVRWLERDPPAVVVIVDADCIVARAALERLAAACLATGRPVQALYLMHAPAGAGLGLRIAEFAWLVKNKLRPLGAAAFGWPCQLMGTGMAFRWELLRTAPLASGHLVEDMQLGLDLAAAGRPPLFCPQALVTSAFPSDADGARAQRTRWEHGHLSVIAAIGPRMLARAVAGRSPALLGMALDLMVPPLAALVLTLASLGPIGAAWWAFAGDPWPLVTAAAGLALLGAAVMLAWWRDGRRIVALNELLGLPLYVAAKIPVYVQLFTKRQIEWVRTKRDGGRR